MNVKYLNIKKVMTLALNKYSRTKNPFLHIYLPHCCYLKSLNN